MQQPDKLTHKQFLEMAEDEINVEGEVDNQVEEAFGAKIARGLVCTQW